MLKLFKKLSVAILMKRNILEFLSIWLFVVMLNQLFILDACFSPVCLIRIVPHTLAIVFIIFYLAKKNDASQKEIQNELAINKPKEQKTLIEISKEDIQALDKLCFIGIGGGGTNIIEYISNLDDKHTFIHVNSDLQSLNQKTSKDKILLGWDEKAGLGCGGKEECGQSLMSEDVKNKLYELTKETELIYVVSTLGGGVGSGVTPEILEYLKSINKRVVVFVTIPFYFEGKIRISIANNAINKIKLYADNLIILKNDELLDKNKYKSLGVNESFNIISNTIFKTIIDWNKMAYNLNNKLVVAVSSRALFDLETENKIFEEKGLDEYYKYQLENENAPIPKGTGFRLIENLLKINKYFSEEEKQVEVIILSRNNAAISLRITNAIHQYKLQIQRSGWTSGRDISAYLQAFKVDLFLSANDNDVTHAIQNGIAAAKILPSNQSVHNSLGDQVRIAFDGDAVLFSEESELIYKEHGLDAFIEHEQNNRDNPLAQGPFAKLLLTISAIQEKFKDKQSPIRTALVTARSAPTHERVIKTLNVWGVRVDEAFFLGGSEKYEVLKAFGADIFFDDQDVHLDLSSSVVPSAKVIYKSNENFKK